MHDRPGGNSFTDVTSQSIFVFFYQRAVKFAGGQGREGKGGGECNICRSTVPKGSQVSTFIPCLPVSKPLKEMETLPFYRIRDDGTGILLDPSSGVARVYKIMGIHDGRFRGAQELFSIRYKEIVPRWDPSSVPTKKVDSVGNSVLVLLDSSISMLRFKEMYFQQQETEASYVYMNTRIGRRTPRTRRIRKKLGKKVFQKTNEVWMRHEEESKGRPLYTYLYIGAELLLFTLAEEIHYLISSPRWSVTLPYAIAEHSVFLFIEQVSCKIRDLIPDLDPYENYLSKRRSVFRRFPLVEICQF